MTVRGAMGLPVAGMVGLQLPNIPQFLIAYFGMLKAGCIAVPLNVLLKAPEVRGLGGGGGRSRGESRAEPEVDPPDAGLVAAPSRPRARSAMSPRRPRPATARRGRRPAAG